MNSSHESLDRVLELACIDLIQRNRRGERARVEEYLQQHPALSNPQYLLDLVDAEICVRKELGESVRVDDWVHRFPNQTKAIEQLISLEVSVNGMEVASSSLTMPTIAMTDANLLSDECLSFATDDSPTVDSGALTHVGDDASLETSPKENFLLKPALFPAPPIKPPQGFVVDSGVSSRPGVWLLRCHEEHRQGSCAFKIIDVAQIKSGQLSQHERKTVLDASERAAKIQHPVWVQPFVATCDGRYLGVIRPWVFGVPWRDGVRGLATEDAFRLFAELAFCLNSAHRSGAHHGNVCENNLFLTHDGNLRLTDPINALSLRMITRNVPLPDLVCNDTMMFCRLIASLQLDASRGLSSQLLAQCHSLALRHSMDAMGMIGEWLVKLADDVNRPTNSLPCGNENVLVGWLKSMFSRRSRDIITKR